MTYLLEVDERPEGHGIRPRSLKVATISALMTEAAQGQGDLSQLAIQGNYRAVAAHHMYKAYSRNIAKHQLCASDFAQSAFGMSAILESIKEDTPVYLEGRRESEASSSET